MGTMVALILPTVIVSRMSIVILFESHLSALPDSDRTSGVWTLPDTEIPPSPCTRRDSERKNTSRGLAENIGMPLRSDTTKAEVEHSRRP